MANQIRAERAEFFVTPEKLMSEIGIKKTTYYKYVKYLGIKKTKDSSGQILISSEDAKRIKALKKYIGENGTKNGFLEQEKTNSHVINDEFNLTKDNDEYSFNGNLSNQSINSSNGLALREDSRIANTEKDTRITPNYEEIYVEPQKETASFSPDDLIREAYELKSREIAMPDLIKRAIADNIEEKDLPVDLQHKIRLAREAANPKFTPESVAEKLLAQYRQNKLSG